MPEQLRSQPPSGGVGMHPSRRRGNVDTPRKKTHCARKVTTLQESLVQSRGMEDSCRQRERVNPKKHNSREEKGKGVEGIAI